MTVLFGTLILKGQEFELRNGDLIFQESCQSDMGNAIKDVTKSIGEYRFTHVGIVFIDSKDSVYVLEATHPKVALTPLQEYLYPSNEKDCYPKSVVGRLKSEYQKLIPHALDIGFTFIGKDYDDGFILDNDKYYCSELVYEILKQANNGSEVFPLNVMTFKSPDTNEFTENWVQYYKKLKMPIPEGEPGINPGAMSRSEVIDIIYYY